MLSDKDPRHFRIVWQYYAGKIAVWTFGAIVLLDFLDDAVIVEHYGVSWDELLPWFVTAPILLLCRFVIKYTREYTQAFFDIEK